MSDRGKATGSLWRKKWFLIGIAILVGIIAVAVSAKIFTIQDQDIEKIHQFIEQKTQEISDIYRIVSNIDDNLSTYLAGIEIVPPAVENEIVSESEDIQYQIGISEERKTLTLPLTKVKFSDYHPVFEYLEHGATVEYCQPDGSWARLSMIDNSSPIGYWEYVLDLYPPQYRALKSAFGEHYEGGYAVEAEVSGDTVLSVNKIINSSGDLVWDASMYVAPRELNEFEKTFIAGGYSFYGQEDYRLDESACPPYEYEEELGWSNLETIARAYAVGTYLYDNKDRLLVNQSGGDDYISYQVVDSLGNILDPIGNFSSDYLVFDGTNSPLTIQRIALRSLSTNEIIENASWVNIVSVDTATIIYVRLPWYGTIELTDSGIGLVNLGFDTLSKFSQSWTEEDILYYYKLHLSRLVW